jgi:preprotein translocase subunit SecG
MLDVTITFLTFVLILTTLFMMLVILMQRPNTNAGMGAAFGGGVTESTFGAETTNILTRATKWSAGAFFGLALVLYILYLVKVQPAAEETIEIDVGVVEGAGRSEADPFARSLLTTPTLDATEIPAEAATTVEEETVPPGAAPAPAE